MSSHWQLNGRVTLVTIMTMTTPLLTMKPFLPQWRRLWPQLMLATVAMAAATCQPEAGKGSGLLLVVAATMWLQMLTVQQRLMLTPLPNEKPSLSAASRCWASASNQGLLAAAVAMQRGARGTAVSGWVTLHLHHRHLPLLAFL